MLTYDQIDSLRSQMDNLLNEYAAILERAPAEQVGMALVDQGKLVLAVDSMTTMLDNAKKRSNRVFDRMQEHFCKRMVDAELIPYRHPDAIFSPSVAGHFRVTDARAFLDFLDRDVDRFLKCTTYKDALRELCEAKFQAGENLPPGIGSYVVAKVSIRRKK